MVALLPVCRQGLATARFYTAFHDLAHGRYCTRHRSVSSLSAGPLLRANDSLCSRQRLPRPLLAARGPRRAHIAAKPHQDVSKSTTAKVTLPENNLRKFRDLDLRHGISLLSQDPCTIRLEERGKDAVVHISGSEDSVAKALEYIQLELAAFQVSGDLPPKDVPFRARRQRQDGALVSDGSSAGHELSTAATVDGIGVEPGPELELPTTPELYEPYKSMMRSVVSPVAVITAVNTPKAPTGGEGAYAGCIGATISSFCSVCVKPTPVVSFNLHRDSGTADAILRSNSVVVHVLAADQNGEAIARAFSDPSKTHPSDPFRAVAALKGHEVAVSTGQETGDWSALLSGPGVLARAHCRHLGDKLVGIGDHLVLFARLLKTEQMGSVMRVPDTTGLSFGQSKYLKSQSLEGPTTELEPTPLVSRKKIKSMPRKSQTADDAPDKRTQANILDEIAQFQAPELPDPAVFYESEQSAGEHPGSQTGESSSSLSSDSKAKSPTSDGHTRQYSTLGRDRYNPDSENSFKRIRVTFPSTTRANSWRPSKNSSAPRFFTPSTTRRTFSTASPSLVKKKNTIITQSHDSTSVEAAVSSPSPTFLRQTVAEYLNIAAMPNHRWRNERTLAELKGYGHERVRLAIRGGTADAEPGSAPGQKTNSLDVRIRLLIERLHSANKLGHVADGVMEELVLGPSEGGKYGKEGSLRRKMNAPRP